MRHQAVAAGVRRRGGRTGIRAHRVVVAVTAVLSSSSNAACNSPWPGSSSAMARAGPIGAANGATKHGDHEHCNQRRCPECHHRRPSGPRAHW